MFPKRTHARVAAVALALAAFGATAGIAFAGWISHAPGIMLALSASGLSWCF